jgi:hypothetical protein
MSLTREVTLTDSNMSKLKPNTAEKGRNQILMNSFLVYIQ